MKTRWFKVLTTATYLPLPLLGIMVIFGVMGRLLHVVCLESAPHVLLNPTLIPYYISLILGAVYGYFKKEDGVYLMAFIAAAVWILGFVLGAVLSLAQNIMIAINVILLAALLALHILQYLATKKWEARITLHRP